MEIILFIVFIGCSVLSVGSIFSVCSFLFKLGIGLPFFEWISKMLFKLLMLIQTSFRTIRFTTPTNILSRYFLGRSSISFLVSRWNTYITALLLFFVILNPISKLCWLLIFIRLLIKRAILLLILQRLRSFRLLIELQLLLIIQCAQVLTR